MNLKEGIKLYNYRAKGFGDGKAVADEQLAKINKFAAVQLTADMVYVRRFLMAHNCIDRDNECFTGDLLDNFAATLPGKGLFDEGHPSSWSGTGGPGEGRFFDASVEEMTPEAFKQLTGETAKIPAGVDVVKVLWGDAYILKLESNADLRAKLDGGICSFVSIGFKAPYFEVTDERGNYTYGEYRPNGEALEGSIVWLGAQPGAGAMKTAGKLASLQADKQKNNEGEKEMKEFLKKLGERMKKTFTEENAVEEIAALMFEKDAQIEGLKLKAADGETYRKNLVEESIRFGAMLEEVPTDEAGQKEQTEFIATWPLQRIKDLRDKYEKRARTQFPDKFTLPSKDQKDKDEKDAEAARKAAETGKKKDYTRPEQNELLSRK